MGFFRGHYRVSDSTWYTWETLDSCLKTRVNDLGTIDAHVVSHYRTSVPRGHRYLDYRHRTCSITMKSLRDRILSDVHSVSNDTMSWSRATVVEIRRSIDFDSTTFQTGVLTYPTCSGTFGMQGQSHRHTHAPRTLWFPSTGEYELPNRCQTQIIDTLLSS